MRFEMLHAFLLPALVLGACGDEDGDLNRTTAPYDADTDAPMDAPPEVQSNAPDSAHVDAASDVEVPFVHTVVVAPLSAVVAPGCTQQFTATAFYSDDTQSDVSDSVQWVSGDPSVANVTEAGLATGLLEGESTITAIWPGPPAAFGEAYFSVGSPSLTSAAIEPTSAFIAVGAAVTLHAYAHFADCTGTPMDLTSIAVWSSGDDSIATVSNGLVTGVGLGAVTIMAQWGGYDMLAEITVTQ